MGCSKTAADVGGEMEDTSFMLPKKWGKEIVAYQEGSGLAMRLCL